MFVRDVFPALLKCVKEDIPTDDVVAAAGVDGVEDTGFDATDTEPRRKSKLVLFHLHIHPAVAVEVRVGSTVLHIHLHLRFAVEMCTAVEVVGCTDTAVVEDKEMVKSRRSYASQAFVVEE